MLCGLRSVGVLYICAGWAALSPGLRYGENSGDSMHAEPHSRTSCHYQIPWLTRLFSKKRLKRKDFQEVACLPWAQERGGSRLPAENCPMLRHSRNGSPSLK